MEVLCILSIKSCTGFLKGKARQGFFVHKGMAPVLFFTLPAECTGGKNAPGGTGGSMLKGKSYSSPSDPPMPAANPQPVYKAVGPMALLCSFEVSIGGENISLDLALKHKVCSYDFFLCR